MSVVRGGSSSSSSDVNCNTLLLIHIHAEEMFRFHVDMIQDTYEMPEFQRDDVCPQCFLVRHGLDTRINHAVLMRQWSNQGPAEVEGLHATR